MATVPQEQLVQRNNKATVGITAGDDTNAGVQQYLITVLAPVTATNTQAVSASYDTPAELEALYATLDAAAATEVDLHDLGFGDDVSGRTLAKLGDTTLSAANSASTTKDISAFVAGGFGTLNYAIDATSVIDLAGCSAYMAGKTLVYISGSTDGTDSVVVKVSDDTGQSVLITVAVTVA